MVRNSMRKSRKRLTRTLKSLKVGDRFTFEGSRYRRVYIVTLKSSTGIELMMVPRGKTYNVTLSKYGNAKVSKV